MATASTPKTTRVHAAAIQGETNTATAKTRSTQSCGLPPFIVAAATTNLQL